MTLASDLYDAPAVFDMDEGGEAVYQDNLIDRTVARDKPRDSRED